MLNLITKFEKSIFRVLQQHTQIQNLEDTSLRFQYILPNSRLMQSLITELVTSEEVI